MRSGWTYIGIWVASCTLLFFALFGPTDAAGFTNGWFVITRPGWLWLTILTYVIIVVVSFAPYLIWRRMPRK